MTNFALNQIPQAICNLAIGRNAYTTQIATIHRAANNIPRLAKAKVYMLAEGQFDGRNNWPGKEVVIFEGRTIGPGQTIGQQAQYSITLVHWLADLHYSSSMSSISHPSNPADMTWAAMHLNPQTGNIPLGSTLLTGCHNMSKLTDVYSIRKDLWGKGLKQILCNIAQQEHVKMGSQLSRCDAVADGKNTQAIAALSRIDGEGDLCNRKNSDYAPKLALSVTGTPNNVVGALFHGFMNDFIRSMISQTIWSKIVQDYASDVSCAVVPLVDHALFVPVTPGIRDTYCKEIDADDYEHARFVFPTTEPLRAVGILSEKGLKTNGTTTNESRISGIGGCFAPSDAHEMGTIRIFRPPTWLNTIQAVDASAMTSTGMRKRTPTSSIYTPQSAKRPETDVRGDEAKETVRVDQTVELFRNYAQVLFVMNSLRGRIGNLVGKLRFDICPGSNVRINAKYEPFIGENDQLANELIGTVVKVTNTLDAEAGEAMTALEFAYVRTPAENKSNSFSVPAHPLFDTPFLGGPMIDSLQFGSCQTRARSKK
jgi:hypothetical protein